MRLDGLCLHRWIVGAIPRSASDEGTGDWLQGAVRFSLSRFNTHEEVLYVNEKMPAIVQRLAGAFRLGQAA